MINPTLKTLAELGSPAMDWVLGGIAIAILLGGLWMLAGGIREMNKEE